MVDARDMHSVEGKVDRGHRLGPRRRARDRAAPRRGAARGWWSRSGSPSSSTRRWPSSPALGVDVLGVRTNIMERDEIDAMVAATVDRFGRSTAS